MQREAMNDAFHWPTCFEWDVRRIKTTQHGRSQRWWAGSVYNRMSYKSPDVDAHNAMSCSCVQEFVNMTHLLCFLSLDSNDRHGCLVNHMCLYCEAASNKTWRSMEAHLSLQLHKCVCIQERQGTCRKVVLDIQIYMLVIVVLSSLYSLEEPQAACVLFSWCPEANWRFADISCSYQPICIVISWGKGIYQWSFTGSSASRIMFSSAQGCGIATYGWDIFACNRGCSLLVSNQLFWLAGHSERASFST